MIRLVYFAWVRELIGRDGESLEPPAEVGTVAELLDWLASLGASYEAALADRSRLRVAVNHDYALDDTPVREGDEVAIFPPVTGG